MTRTLTFSKPQARRYDWKPALPGTLGPRMSRPKALPSFPKRFSQRKSWCVCYDQGQLGGCTGNMWAGMVAYALMKEGKLTITKANTPAGVPSRLMIYWLERWLEGTVNTDAGADIPDGAKALIKYGVCFENVWPYNIALFRSKPPAIAFKMALQDVVKGTESIASPVDTGTVKLAIMTKNEPVGMGFTVYESFESDQVAGDGLVPVPGPNESVLGGHAVVRIGWDDDKVIPAVTYSDGSTAGPWKGAWEVRNSWGIWGDHGYFWMPYAYADDTNQVSDLMVVSSGP